MPAPRQLAPVASCQVTIGVFTPTGAAGDPSPHSWTSHGQIKGREPFPGAAMSIPPATRFRNAVAANLLTSPGSFFFLARSSSW